MTKEAHNANLADLVDGSEGQIEGFSAEGKSLRRFREMGLMKGTKFKVIRRAPLGDPIEISVRGALLSVRSEQAVHILVSETSAATDSTEDGKKKSV